MKYLSVVCALCVLVALTNGAPMPQSGQENGLDTRAQTIQIVNGINNKLKLLREYYPQLFQVIDNVIQNVTSTAFRVLGRVILQSGALGIGGGGGGGDDSSEDSRVSVVLPTFGPDDDEYEEEDEEEDNDNSVSSGSSSSTTEASSTTTTTTTAPSSSASDVGVSTQELTDDVDIRIEDKRQLVALNVITHDTANAPFTSPASETRSKRETAERTIRAAEDSKADDQDASASGGNALNPSDDLSNVEADDADRDKRFLPFGGSFGAGASGGSTGGSGNFLFDIIRSTADGAARAAGTVYRMIAGTENVGLGFTATASSARTFLPQLVAGSGATEDNDEKDNAPAAPGGLVEIDVAKSASAEGIPGPITRLFVLANRGLANLIQDLILRIASTSERIVNFKARLITALI